MLLQYLRSLPTSTQASTLKSVSDSEIIRITLTECTGVLPGNKFTLMVDSNNRSGSAVSLLSPEAEQALLKVSIIRYVIILKGTYVCNNHR